VIPAFISFNENARLTRKNCSVLHCLKPEKQTISNEKKALIDRLLLEKIPLAGIARAVGVSERWLQNYVNEKYDSVPKVVDVTPKKKGKITIQCDEMWSFVCKKGNKYWIWLAIDIETGEIVGVYIGSRSAEGAKGLWDSLPPVYRQCAVCYTDFWKAYDVIFPKKRHKSVGKGTGLTNRIERFNCTMRQRISRLVRSTLSFSKKLSNHIGAIWYFIHDYNASILT
jgi:insertion element IS1 protein InsB